MHIIYCTPDHVKLWRNAGFIVNQADIEVNFSVNGSKIQCQPMEVSASDYEIGDWVVVRYEGDEYPGEVTE